MGNKRVDKFYYRNEKETLTKLGFKPTYASGSGMVEKEDGQTKNLIAQLKTTDAGSIRINLFDLQRLESNAVVSNKRAVFVIQFLKDNSVYLMVKPDKDIMELLHNSKEDDIFEF